MNVFTTTAKVYARWLDSVANVILLQLSRFGAPNTVRIAEDVDGAFAFQSDDGSNSLFSPPPKSVRLTGDRVDHDLLEKLTALLSSKRVEVTLQSNRFVFRTL